MNFIIRLDPQDQVHIHELGELVRRPGPCFICAEVRMHNCISLFFRRVTDAVLAMSMFSEHRSEVRLASAKSELRVFACDAHKSELVRLRRLVSVPMKITSGTIGQVCQD